MYKCTLVSALSERRTRARRQIQRSCSRFTKTPELLCHLCTLLWNWMSLLTNSLPYEPNRVAAAPAIYTKPLHLWEMPAKILQGPIASFWVIPGHPALLTMWWSVQPNSWPHMCQSSIIHKQTNMQALWNDRYLVQSTAAAAGCLERGSDPSFFPGCEGWRFV